MQTTTSQSTEHSSSQTTNNDNQTSQTTDPRFLPYKDPVDRLGRKRLCLETFKVYMQVFRDGEVVGHIERKKKRGMYDCFHNDSLLGLRFNITKAIDLVMNTDKRRHD